MTQSEIKMTKPTKNKYKVLNMCNFCIYDIETCKASYVLSKDVEKPDKKLGQPDSVIACDKYTSPVDTINKQNY